MYWYRLKIKWDYKNECVFFGVGTCLLARCVATKGSLRFTQTQRLKGGIYEVAVEMDSGVMAYTPSFIKIGSGIRTLKKGFTDTPAAWRMHKRTVGKWDNDGRIDRSRVECVVQVKRLSLNAWFVTWSRWSFPVL
jgi:hypothetical protein